MIDDFVLFHGSDEIDPDIALISAYLAGELALVQVGAVEERLLSDLAFRRKVQPVIDAWIQPVSFAPGATRLRVSAQRTTVLTAAELEAGWQRVVGSHDAVPAGPRLVADHLSASPTRRTRSMTRIAATIAAVALPMVAVAQATIYAARHQEVPGHSIAKAVVSSFVSTPAPDKTPPPTPQINGAEDYRLGRPLKSAPVAALPTGAGRESAPVQLPVTNTDPSRAQITALVKQHQASVARGEVEANYVVLLLDATGKYLWSTSGIGSVHIDVGGDERSPLERREFERRFRAEFLGAGDSATWRRPRSVDSLQVLRLMRDSALFARMDTNRMVRDSTKPRFALAAPGRRGGGGGGRGRGGPDTARAVDRGTYVVVGGGRGRGQSDTTAAANWSYFARGGGRGIVLDTAGIQPGTYRTGWSYNVSGLAMVNQALGLERPRDGSSGIVGQQAANIARSDIYQFVPGEIGPKALRVVAVYLK